MRHLSDVMVEDAAAPLGRQASSSQSDVTQMIVAKAVPSQNK